MENDSISMWTKVCAVCGKEFIPPNTETWVYKSGKVWFCRYNHMREWEKMNDESEFRPQCHSGRKMMDNPVIRKIIRLGSEGVPVNDIAIRCGVKRQLVYYYLRTRK